MCKHVSRAERVCTWSACFGLCWQVIVYLRVLACIKGWACIFMCLHVSEGWMYASICLHTWEAWYVFAFIFGVLRAERGPASVGPMCMWICWHESRARHVTTREPLTARLATDLPCTCWGPTELPSATEASMYLIKALLQTGARTLPSGIWMCAGPQCLAAARLSTADAISCRHVFCALFLRHVS